MQAFKTRILRKIKAGTKLDKVHNVAPKYLSTSSRHFCIWKFSAQTVWPSKQNVSRTIFWANFIFKSEWEKPSKTTTNKMVWLYRGFWLKPFVTSFKQNEVCLSVFILSCCCPRNLQTKMVQKKKCTNYSCIQIA